MTAQELLEWVSKVKSPAQSPRQQPLVDGGLSTYIVDPNNFDTDATRVTTGSSFGFVVHLPVYEAVVGKSWQNSEWEKIGHIQIWFRQDKSPRQMYKFFSNPPRFGSEPKLVSGTSKDCADTCEFIRSEMLGKFEKATGHQAVFAQIDQPTKRLTDFLKEYEKIFFGDT